MSEIVDHLAGILSENKDKIDSWFSEQYARTPTLFYSSVDLRHSGKKIVPVDTNIFPAGFNLLSDEALERCTKEVKAYFEKYYPKASKLLLIPESHTRNLFYLENVVNIKSILEKSGLEVRIGGFNIDDGALDLTSASGIEFKAEHLNSSNNKINVGNDNFTPDVVLVNNDLSSGAPEILQNIDQPVIPPVGMGWYRRRKTRHFDTYDEVSRGFSNEFGIDKWLISSVFSKCGTINFKQKEGLECVAINVEKTLHIIKEKYQTYGIEDDPYVFVKADSGTYGMGIMTVRSADELMEMNKKERNKMNIIKEGVVNSEVIIQEGIPTIDKVDGKAAEPLVYLINGNPVGCTYRVNENRDAYSNLNSPGMSFDNACENDDEKPESNLDEICPVRGLIAKLASLAATRECYEPKWDI